MKYQAASYPKMSSWLIMIPYLAQFESIGYDGVWYVMILGNLYKPLSLLKNGSNKPIDLYAFVLYYSNCQKLYHHTLVLYYSIAKIQLPQP